MLELIKEYALVIVGALGVTNLLAIAATVLRHFSHKKMNNAFDIFNSGAKMSVETIEKLSRGVNVLADTVKGIHEVLNCLETTISDLSTRINELETNSILTDLQKSLLDLETVKQALNYKDEAIDAYAKDMYKIRVALNTLNGSGGYDDILETK